MVSMKNCKGSYGPVGGRFRFGFVFFSKGNKKAPPGGRRLRVVWLVLQSVNSKAVHVFASMNRLPHHTVMPASSMTS